MLSIVKKRHNTVNSSIFLANVISRSKTTLTNPFIRDLFFVSIITVCYNSQTSISVSLNTEVTESVHHVQHSPGRTATAHMDKIHCYLHILELFGRRQLQFSTTFSVIEVIPDSHQKAIWLL